MIVEFHNEAEIELLQTKEYYNEIIDGLGDSFILEIEKKVYRIKKNPVMYPKIRKGIRKCNSKKFPYFIYYKAIKETIYILAISHQMRKPFYWSKRKISDINTN